MFTSGDLAGMRSAQLAHMQDTCVRRAWSRSYGDYNQPIDTWTDAGGEQPCGLDPGPGSEAFGQDRATVTWDAVLRIPISDVWNVKDRVRITKRYGESLAVPIEYQVASPPQRGPSGMRLLLVKVEV